MNEDFDLLLDRYAVETESHEVEELPLDDDRYPGSFFRVPHPPVSGQASWSLR